MGRHHFYGKMQKSERWVEKGSQTRGTVLRKLRECDAGIQTCEGEMYHCKIRHAAWLKRKRLLNELLEKNDWSSVNQVDHEQQQQASSTKRKQCIEKQRHHHQASPSE
jgi:hypothetical protein